MTNILLLALCLLIGVVAARWGNPPEGMARGINWWVLNIAMPALILELVPHLHVDASLWFLFVITWFTFGLTWLVLHHLGKALGWSRGRQGALIMTASLGNTAFVGLPLIEALRGKEALPYAAIADQLGSFLMLSFGGTLVCALYSGRPANAGQVVRRVLQFPPFIALLCALLLLRWPVLPATLDAVLARISSTVAPLAIFSVGLQLRVRFSADRALPLFLGLGWKLGAIPLVVLLCAWALNIPEAIRNVTVIQGAMAPMVTAAILCDQYDLDPPLANMMVGLGVVLSFITAPLWNWML